MWVLHLSFGEKLGYPEGARRRAAAPLRGEEPDEVAQASYQDDSLVRCSGHVPLGGDLRENPGHAGGTMSLSCLGMSREELDEVAREREVLLLHLRLIHAQCYLQIRTELSVRALRSFRLYFCMYH